MSDAAARTTRRAVWGIVLAAGTGRRFGEAKQFARLAGERLVDRAVRLIHDSCEGVVIVLPPDTRWDGPPVSATVTGGSTRHSSVAAGLAVVPDDAEIVVIHDAAHPLAPRELFTDVVAAVRSGADAAAPALPLPEALKRTLGTRVVATVQRADIVLVQTPQAFRAETLRAAHRLGVEAAEDTELLERLGANVVTVPGDVRNIHVTSAGDIEVAERLV